MRTIWKCELHLVGEQSVSLPKGANLLCVQVQRDTPCVWAIVDPSDPKEDRAIYCRGTGHPLGIVANHDHYLGTTQHDGGALIFHWFC